MDINKEIVAVCSPEGKPGELGAIEKCSDCGTDVWLSKERQDHILELHKDVKKSDIRLCCFSCAIPLIAKAGTPISGANVEKLVRAMRGEGDEGGEDYDYKNIENKI